MSLFGTGGRRDVVAVVVVRVMWRGVVVGRAGEGVGGLGVGLGVLVAAVVVVVDSTF